MIDEQLLKREEKAVFALRSLYRKYGYLPYQMSKFEEYELYLRNKDFLVSDRIITFNDIGGRLLALKPDVTLSILKNGEDTPGCKQKVYYNENVYRVSERTQHYKEIMQAGLECIGDIDLYDIYEVILLAAESLSRISDAFVLEISHLGILSEVLGSICSDKIFVQRALRHIAQKNAHDLTRLCAQYGIGERDADRLARFTSMGGERAAVLRALKEIYDGSLLEPLETLSHMLDACRASDKIRFDFSVVNNMNYYNGFVFKGFLNGVCDGVLTGGQYDKLMEKMHRSSGAIGFAIYLDLLEQLSAEKSDFDVDVLLLYSADDDSAAVAEKVRGLIEKGLAVSAQKAAPEKLRFRKCIDLREEKSC